MESFISCKIKCRLCVGKNTRTAYRKKHPLTPKSTCSDFLSSHSCHQKRKCIFFYILWFFLAINKPSHSSCTLCISFNELGVIIQQNFVILKSIKHEKLFIFHCATLHPQFTQFFQHSTFLITFVSFSCFFALLLTLLLTIMAFRKNWKA